MKTHVLKGSKQEIAENLVRISGEVCEAIVFIEEPTPPTAGAHTPAAEDFFAEMHPLMVAEFPGTGGGQDPDGWNQNCADGLRQRA